MKLSIVDTSPVLDGSTAVEAFETTRRLAQLAERAGFTRYWSAELHGIPTNANASPEIAIATIAANTSRIRVGSGAVLLNQRSPFSVAESYQQLNATFPDRIDLGLGRATAGRLLDLALQTSRRTLAPPDDYADKVTEVLRWFDGFEAGHPFAGVPFFEGVSGRPKPWILGSSPTSAVVAARLGLPYAFASFLNPGAAQESLRTYRQEFEPSQFASGIRTPYAILGVNLAAGEDDAEARRVQAGGEAVRRSVAAGVMPNGVPRWERAIDQLGGLPPRFEYVPGRWPRSIAADPARLREIVKAMAEEVQADEVIIQDLIAEPHDRLRSYGLIAEAFELECATTAEQNHRSTPTNA